MKAFTRKIRRRAGRRQVRVCSSLFSKMIGFMFSFNRKRALLFAFSRDARIRIHTMFCFFPLSVEWFDSKGKVVARRVMKPFSFYNPERKCRYVLEVPC